MNKGFPDIVRQKSYEIYNGYCQVKNCYDEIHSYHHKLPETEYNIKRFPLLIHSVINCAPVCLYHHNNHRKYSELNMNEKKAIIIETYLEELKNENSNFKY